MEAMAPSAERVRDRLIPLTLSGPAIWPGLADTSRSARFTLSVSLSAH